MMKLRVIVMSLLLFLFSVIAQALEYSSSGFYWPLKDDTPNFSSCGRWLERGSPNGCYPQDSGPKVYHIGSDMSTALNSSVYAISDGEVKMHLSGWGDGNVGVLVRHKTTDGKSFRVIYGHIRSNSAAGVGSTVRGGDKIGEIGYWSNGNHLHFGVLNPNLSMPPDTSSFGRWSDSNYGVKNDGYYDNGFIDPIWFITHNAPDNWISKTIIIPNNLAYPISPANPWFIDLCMNTSPPDSRCDGSDITSFQECVYEGSSLCAPSINDYSAVNGGGFHSSGGAGGDTGGLPDFIIKKIWLSDSTGNAKTVFSPGEAMQIHIEVKNDGADTGSGIDVDYFRSNGFYKDSDPTNVGMDFIHKDDLKGGETHTELKNTTAPTTLGTYNMTAHADSGHDVDEEHESNNWSSEAVFTVANPVNNDWLWLIINYVLN